MKRKLTLILFISAGITLFFYFKLPQSTGENQQMSDFLNQKELPNHIDKQISDASNISAQSPKNINPLTTQSSSIQPDLSNRKIAASPSNAPTSMDGLDSSNVIKNSTTSIPDNSIKTEPGAEKKSRLVKLDFNGAELPDESENWSCVLDNDTGLIWEVKTNFLGTHFKGDKYRWSIVDTPQNENEQCSYFLSNERREGDADIHCTTSSIVLMTNIERLCNFNNWRLPSLGELQSIVDRKRKNPSINTTYFPNTQSGYYWTGEPFAYDEFGSWAITFRGGVQNDKKKNTNNYVRLVGKVK
jgi:Protein of unknown function (DUF1566)